MPSANTILLVLGIILFVVLLFLLLFRKPDAKLLVPLFLVSIVMIGYPTIYSVKIGDTVDIQKYGDSIVANPNDEHSAQSLSAAIKKPGAVKEILKNPAVASRTVVALCTAAAARTVAKNYSAADALLAQAKQLAPASPDIAFVEERLTAARKTNPANLERELAPLRSKYRL